MGSGIIMVLAYLLSAVLTTADLEIGGKEVRVEIADTPKFLAKGLMGRTSLADGEGMLFVFEKSKILSFWMKNTLIPLSVGFFDEEKRLINAADMSPVGPGADSWPTFESKSPAQYALEVPQGWFARNHIQPGMKFTLNNFNR